MKLKILTIFAIMYFSIGCSHIYIAEQPKEESLFRVHGICVKVVFVNPAKMKRLAPGANGFYDVDHNTIFVLQPRHWSDFARIETLGHELLHALGAIHSENHYYGKNEPIRWQWELH